MTTRLVGDIGGTNARFAKVVDGEMTQRCTVPTASLGALNAIWKLLDERSQAPDVAIVAVAAPVDGDTATLTNLNLTLDIRTAGAPRYRLLNDLEAAAAGVAAVPAHLQTRLLDGVAVSTRPTLVVGVGTGIGSALVLPDGQILAGEGGHAPLAPTTPALCRMVMALQDTLARPVEWEDLLSGRGLGRFRLWANGDESTAIHGDKATLEHFASTLSNAAADALFAHVLADYIRGAALFCRAGRVVVFGGVANALRPALATTAFGSHIRCPGPVSAVLQHVPVDLLTDDDIALRGCASM